MFRKVLGSAVVVLGVAAMAMPAGAAQTGARTTIMRGPHHVLGQAIIRQHADHTFESTVVLTGLKPGDYNVSVRMGSGQTRVPTDSVCTIHVPAGFSTGTCTGAVNGINGEFGRTNAISVTQSTVTNRTLTRTKVVAKGYAR
jgi:hypothetical protein